MADAGWWSRFGAAEAAGTIMALAGFGFAQLRHWPLPAAAGLATLAEVIGFYGVVIVKTAIRATHATTHLAGARRLGAALWHAVHDQLASAGAAELIDDLLVRPGLMTLGAWGGAHWGTAGLWLGFIAGKALADLAWYVVEAHARLLAALARRDPAQALGIACIAVGEATLLVLAFTRIVPA